MNRTAKPDTSLDRSKIAAVRKALNEAVKRSEARDLTDLLTDDVVAVHEDGRCMCGKQEVEAFFRHAFARYDIEAAILSSDIIFTTNGRSRWMRWIASGRHLGRARQSRLALRLYSCLVGSPTSPGRLPGSLSCRSDCGCDCSALMVVLSVLDAIPVSLLH